MSLPPHLPPHLRALGLGGVPVGVDGSGVTVAVLDAGVRAVEGLADHLICLGYRDEYVIDTEGERDTHADIDPGIGADIDGDIDGDIGADIGAGFGAEIGAGFGANFGADPDADPLDHATRCASLIASRHPQAPGVAPGAQLVSVPVAPPGARVPNPAAVAAALELSAARRFHVVFCGFVLEALSPALEEAARAYLSQGGVLIGAGGNSPRRRGFPFVRNLPGAIAVEAASGLSRPVRDAGALGAPGDHLVVLDREGRVDRAWRGQSSGAAALVAGVAALALSAQRSPEARRRLAATLGEQLRRTSGPGAVPLVNAAALLASPTA